MSAPGETAAVTGAATTAPSDDGLRQRQVSGKESATVDTDISAKTEKYVKALGSVAPAAMKPYIEKMASALGLLAAFIQKLIPVIHSLYVKYNELAVYLAPYNLELLLPSFAGLIMCFFGGTFMTTIAAVEAYRMVGYQTTIDCIMELKGNFDKFMIANKKDDETDADGNGQSDTMEMTPQQLVQHKTLLFLRTVDPEKITNAIGGINSGFIAVIATLKVQFVKAITLGNAIAATMEGPIMKYLLPIVEMAIPKDYKKWAKPMISAAIKSTAVSIAWFVQRVISCWHSGITGGLMFSRNMLEYLSIKKIIKIDPNDTYLDEVVGYALAVVGVYFQLRHGFGLPWVLSILLFPLSVVEYTLMYFVAK